MSSILLFFLVTMSDALAGDDMIKSMIRIVNQDYLWKEDLQPKDALVEAAESLENAIPWLIVEAQDGGIQFMHGEDGAFAFLPYPKGRYKSLHKDLRQLAALIQKTSYPIDPSIDLEVEMLRGVARSLDRYSVVMHKDGLRRFNERIRGRLSGIGCRVQAHSQGLRVKEVFPEGPAEEAGVRAGDVITHTGQHSLKGLSVNQSVGYLRGQAGSKVELHLLRNKTSFKKSLIRNYVRIPNVRWSIQEGIGMITIESFSEQTMRWLNQALGSFRLEKKLRGIVLDLRGNSGGSMIQACKTVDAFVDQGIALRTVGRDGNPVRRLLREYPLKQDDEFQVPMVVLINRRSASASEIVAGALKLSQRALVIGRRSHGKGVVQMPHRLRIKPVDKRVTLKLTVAQYLLTGDYSVHDQNGITPHIWASPLIFDEDYAYVSRRAKGLTYAVERHGWREKKDLRKDFLLEFAQELLQTRRLKADVKSMTGVAKRLIARREKQENQLIVEAYKARNMDWRAGKSSPQFKDIKIRVEAPKVANAGEAAKVKVHISNEGEEPLYQARIYLSTDHDELPWDGMMISVGHVPPGKTVTGVSQVEISSRLRARTDEVRSFLQTKNLIEHPVTTQLFSIQARPRPAVQAHLDIQSNGSKHKLRISLQNLSSQTLENVKIKLGLPNDKSISFLSDGTILLPSISARGSSEVQFDIAAKKPLSQIQSLQVRVDSKSFRRLIDAELEAHKLQQKVTFLSPQILAKIPLRVKSGDHRIKMKFSDDGQIVQSALWLDNEKIGWRSRQQQWDELISLSPGSHRIEIEVEDDQQLRSIETFHIWVDKDDE